MPVTPTEIAAFRASLGPKDRLIHELAAQMLKTRYTPERSNAWIAWKKSLTLAAPAPAPAPVTAPAKQ